MEVLATNREAELITNRTNNDSWVRLHPLLLFVPWCFRSLVLSGAVRVPFRRRVCRALVVCRLRVSQVRGADVPGLVHGARCSISLGRGRAAFD